MLLIFLFCMLPGKISEKGNGCSVSMQADAHVHLRLCLLFEEKPSVTHF